MDRLDAIEAFVVTVDRGSLTSAARSLGRSITAISRAITSLEERVGLSLVERSTRSLRLTEAGARYVEVARRVLRELADAEKVALSALDAPQGTLTVSAPVSFGAMHVRPLVDAYLAKYPDVRGKVLLVDRIVNVIDEGIDVALRIGHLPDSSLVATSVGFVRRVVCASSAYVARHGKPRDPSELAKHRCIAFTALTPTETWTFASGPKGGRAKQVRIDAALTVNTAQAAIGSALEGRGITCALSYQVDEAIVSGKLIALLTAYEPDPRPVHLVQPASAVTAAKVKRFVEMATPALRRVLTPQRSAQGRSH
jgi:DNA-binding transcriptional LysR family regulator